MLYFAYGSNLNKEHMAQRCPNATPVCKIMMPDQRLVFRGVADCIYEPGAICPGAIWKITAECERALDIYEGVRSSMYRKEYLELDKPFMGETRIMLYRMNSTGIMPPSEDYFASICEGYADFALPTALLDKALHASWDDKHPSHKERKRHRRNGRPALARKGDQRK